MVDALVFDFDGVILDTETPLFHAWTHTFESFGATPVDLSTWCASLGRNASDPLYFDPLTALQKALGTEIAESTVQAVRRAERDRLLAEAPVALGLDALLDRARELDVAVAIASSSPRHWLDRHLGARGLAGRFPIICCAGEGVPGKPDPAVYLHACAELEVEPSRAVAVEDSPHGVAAAKAAGMGCIAVPTPVSESLDFSHADIVVKSLEDVDLDRIGVAT